METLAKILGIICLKQIKETKRMNNKSSYFVLIFDEVMYNTISLE